MHIPAAFRQDDLTQLHAQMRQNPLAALVSHGASGLQAALNKAVAAMLVDLAAQADAEAGAAVSL